MLVYVRLCIFEHMTDKFFPAAALPLPRPCPSLSHGGGAGTAPAVAVVRKIVILTVAA